MKDPEFAHAEGIPPSAPFIHDRNARDRRAFSPKRVLTIMGVAALLVGVMFGIGILASCVQTKFHSANDGDMDMNHAPSVFNEQAEMAHQIVDRDENCDHGKMAVETMASLVVDRAAAAGGDTLLAETDEGVRVPISTATELETFYSISKPPVSTTETSSTPPLSPSTEECGVAIVTETQTVISTVTMIPVTTSEGYTTVTGDPATVTDINTDTSYTSGLPDVTISGDPLTLTNTHTDLSYTSGLPDATISGNPSTVTEVDMSYSLTAGTSVVTVVVTDLWGTNSLSEPLTTVSTLSETVEGTSTTTMTAVTPVIVTISALYPPPGETDESSTTHYTSAAKGGGISLTLADPPYPTNGTTIIGPSGTVTGYPTAPPTVVPGSASPKKPEPFFSNSNGSSHLGCTVMLVALMMYML